MATGRRASSLASDTIRYALGLSLQLLVQIAYLLLLARMLESSGYGMFVSVTSLGVYVGAFAHLGMPHVLVRDVTQGRRPLPQALAECIGTTLIIGNLLVIVAGASSPWWNAAGNSLSTIIVILFSDVVLLRLNEILFYASQAIGCHGQAALISIAPYAARLIALVMFWALGGRSGDLQTWSYGYLSATMAALAFTAWRFHRRLDPAHRPGRPRIPDARSLRDGFGFALVVGSLGLNKEFDKTVLPHFVSTAHIGPYAIASRVIGMASIPVSALHQAVYARFFKAASAQGQGQGSWQMACSLTVPVLVISTSCALIAWLLSPLAILLLGDSFSAIRVWIPCLIPVAVIGSVNVIVSNAVTTSGYPVLCAAIQTGSAILSLLLVPLLCAQAGIGGAVISGILVSSMSTVVLTCILWRVHLTANRST